ncbi:MULTISPECIES: hypothetical protein [Spirosoma]|uniref:Uncharacterized protein n=1 Tax=Spirosoma sordidisoli TaxID=2502893 RepID=A0A4Q2URT1_9BACT|nr:MULTISPECIES: hypothetical protein [Spirosoma]RYC69539.1 hypothetical protein EQG79_13110 [Spirosoma sordidisoli]
MEDLSPEQIVELANGYRSLARSLNEFQVSHWPDLTVEQHLDLNAYQSSLLNRAQDLQTLAVRPAFRDAAELIARIQQATTDAQDSLKRIRNLTIALNIGAITVALASYIARANLRGIQTALRELGDLLSMSEETT